MVGTDNFARSVKKYMRDEVGIVPGEPVPIDCNIYKVGKTVDGDCIPCVRFSGFACPVAYIKSGKISKKVKSIGESLTVAAPSRIALFADLPGETVKGSSLEKSTCL